MPYEPTLWKYGDLITEERMNHLEQGVANEQVGPPGANGISPTVSISSSSNGTVVTITDATGAHSFEVLNGATGSPGAPGSTGSPGEGVPAGGTTGQVLSKESDQNYDTVWIDPPQGVTSFNGRNGAVTPQDGDYTAAMVGARPNTWNPTAADVGAATMEQVNQAIAAIPQSIVGPLTQAQYDALSQKSSTTLYCIKE